VSFITKSIAASSAAVPIRRRFAGLGGSAGLGASATDAEACVGCLIVGISTAISHPNGPAMNPRTAPSNPGLPLAWEMNEPTKANITPTHKPTAAI